MSTFANVDLSQPVGTISIDDARAKMISRSAMTKEQCIEMAQKSGACGEADDWCYYYSFKPGAPKEINTGLFGNFTEPQPGSCFMGPDKAQNIELSLEGLGTANSDPSGGLALYITPSSEGNTAEQKYLNTTKQLIKRSQAQLQAQIKQDTQKNESNLVALQVLQSAIEKGQSFAQAKQEYQQNLAEHQKEKLAQEQEAKREAVEKSLATYGNKQELQKQILSGKDAVLTERDAEVVQKEKEAHHIKRKLLEVGQEIMNFQTKYTQKDKLAQILIVVLFCLTIFAFLMFTYYGVKFARGNSS